MPLVEYVPDPRRYDGVFVSQLGYGPMIRYRGSSNQHGSGFPQLLKALFSKIAAFAKPILRTAAPHARKAFEAAQPHLQEAATGLVRDVGSKATEAISKKLTELQDGSGRKRKKIGQRKAKKTRRLPLHKLPDFI